MDLHSDGPKPGGIEFGTSGDEQKLLPQLAFGEWVVFMVLAAVMAGANIYTTLLIGWGDTGSIIAVLAAVALLGLVSKRKPSVHVLNLGQTLVSAGGSVGFAVASYAAVHIVQPDFNPSKPVLIAMFASMGLLGALIGSSVRRYMVKYFFPSGTACAVIQTSVARHLAPGERNRPVWMLKIWGGLAALLTIPTKITTTAGGHAFWEDIKLQIAGIFGNYPAGERPSHDLGVGVDPLYYGIGIVVGPRIGIGMLIGVPASAAIFFGGVIKSVVTQGYVGGKTGEDKAAAAAEAGNDTMLAGASIFAAGAVLSIVLILMTSVLKYFNAEFFYIAGGH
ncbi:MAG: OPT/YSL family transporter [Planctomycetes bacterium]|nr:OPT/YSL family transporter [Planctomycetota bacterium]